ncbi:MAG: TetR/AcrR family transcriptional regulator [Edaphobacter sp.]
MGRRKLFSREEVLAKAISVFWEKGFADTSVQDLERTTGVNKSGLYVEFKDKKDIFLESLRYYLETRGGDGILATEPKGWHNVERFLAVAQTCYVGGGRRGCFSVNSLRDIALLPPDAQQIIDKNTATLKRLLISNIKAELPGATNAPLLADLVLTFFSGLCIEQNVASNQAAISRKITSFMNFLRAAH